MGPLTPADCDLRGLEYMPLLGQHLFGSEFNARANDAEWRAALTLWWAAWTQKPAASLPDDDTALCRLADLGRDLKTWRKVKAMALYGFVLCDDGRLYHPTLSKQALIAWEKRTKERARKAEWREKKKGQDADVPRDATGTETGTEQSLNQGQDADVPADENRRDGTGRDVSKKEEVPLDKSNGADGQILPFERTDPKQAFWDSAKGYLGASKSSMIGKWISVHGIDATGKAITEAQLASAVDPVSYINRVLVKRDKTGAVELTGPC